MTEETTALVTGGAGFIGSHIVRGLCRKGVKVSVLYRPGEDLKNLSGLDVETLQGDLSEPGGLSGILPDVDYVFHFAAIMGEGMRGFDYMHRVNTGGSRFLIDHYLKKGKKLKRFIFSSSIAVAGPTPEDGRADEKSEPRPVSEYGESKLKTERYLTELGDRFPFTIFRLPMVYGPANRRGILMLFRMINKGIFIANIRNRFSVGYIDDIVEFVFSSLENDGAAGEMYYIGDPRVYHTSEIMEAIASALERKPVKLRIPFGLMYAVCTLVEKTSDLLGRKPTLRRDSIKSYFEHNWCVSTDKAERELGYRIRFPPEKGIPMTAKWYRDNGFL